MGEMLSLRVLSGRKSFAVFVQDGRENFAEGMVGGVFNTGAGMLRIWGAARVGLKGRGVETTGFILLRAAAIKILPLEDEACAGELQTGLGGR